MEPINWFMMVVTQHYFDLNGRARRAEFWWYMLVVIVGAIPVYLLGWIIGLSFYAVLAYQLALFLPTLSVMVRRMQDTNRPAVYVYGYYALSIAISVITAILPLMFVTPLLGLVSLAAAVVMIVLLAQPGTPGPNAYGPDPKAGLAPAT
jgi:uncharacterized membrane protein YhaH (DUF805 family)